MYYVYIYYKDFNFHQIQSGIFPAKNSCILKRACHPLQFLHGEALMATAANKNKIKTFEAGQNFTGS